MKGNYKLDIQLFAEDPKTGPEGGAKDPTVEELLNSLENLQNTMVSKEEYDKIKESNSKLIKQLTSERTFVQPNEEVKVVTHEDIVKRCQERTEKLGDGTSLDQIKLLTENYRDMQTLGLDVDLVDENVVVVLENMIEESKGDPVIFKAIAEKRIRN